MQRLDLLLVEQGLAETRTQAQKMLDGGRVQLFKAGEWQVVNKPGLKLPADSQLQVESAEEDRYVSRGAFKLLAALQAAQLNVSGLTALDIGQSTGGFTDVLLQAGAKQVVGLDVGQNQLHPRLQDDPRVVALEKINARNLLPDLFSEQDLPLVYDLIVMDVSFISQTLILPQLPVLLAPSGWLMTLVKPQFEVGKEKIGKGGIVRDPALYAEVEQRIRDQVSKLGLNVTHWLPSPITGGDGNREFLMVAQNR